MEQFNVSYRNTAGVKQIGVISAFDLDDAKATVKRMVMIDNNRFFDTTIIRVWLPKPPTAKQKLAQRYGYIIGGIGGAQSSFNYTKMHLFPNGVDSEKAKRAFGLVDSQFAKLKRDIADAFKLAGLNIKGAK